MEFFLSLVWSSEFKRSSFWSLEYGIVSEFVMEFRVWSLSCFWSLEFAIVSKFESVSESVWSSEFGVRVIFGVWSP